MTCWVDTSKVSARRGFCVTCICSTVGCAEITQLTRRKGGSVGEDRAVSCEYSGKESKSVCVKNKTKNPRIENGCRRGTGKPYKMVVISGGDRLSSRRSPSASESSILISGRPGIMTPVGSARDQAPSLICLSGASLADWQCASTTQPLGGVQKQSSGKKKQLSR